jgi:hypothetical protein
MSITIQSEVEVSGVGDDTHFSLHSDGSLEARDAGASATFSPDGAIGGVIGVPGTNGISGGPSLDHSSGSRFDRLTSAERRVASLIEA